MQYHMINSDLIQVWDKALHNVTQKVNFVPIKKENVVALKVSDLLPHKSGCFLIVHQGLREPSQITFAFLAFDHVRNPPSFHFLCSTSSIFLTTYPKESCKNKLS